MNKIILIVALLIATSVSFAQTNSKDNKTPKTKQEKVDRKAPVITFEKTTHDYGTIEKGDNGVCEFIFKNTGKKPLILTKVKASCGCTTPEWPKEPIKRGKKAVIKVKYDTKRVGNINKSITVTSNASNSPVRLFIKGKILNPNQKDPVKKTKPQPKKHVKRPVKKAEKKQ